MKAGNSGNRHGAKHVTTTPLPDYAAEAAKRATEEALARRSEAGLKAEIDAIAEVVEAGLDALSSKPERKPQRDVTDELVSRLERRWEAERTREAGKQIHDDLQARWSHKQGAPETLDRIEAIPRRQRQTPLLRMYKSGKVSVEELAAAEQICDVIEMIQRAVAPKTARLEARVDCEGAAKDVLVEGLRRIRLEHAYSIWRDKIPEPKHLILEMIQTNLPYTQQARKFGINWRTARKRLISSLQLWIAVLEDVHKNVSAKHVHEIYDKIGGGTLLAPPPKPKKV